MFPWQVLLGKYNEFDVLNSHCGGSLITPNMALTAAHCFFENDPDKPFKAKEYVPSSIFIDVFVNMCFNNLRQI